MHWLLVCLNTGCSSVHTLIVGLFIHWMLAYLNTGCWSTMSMRVDLNTDYWSTYTLIVGLAIPWVLLYHGPYVSTYTLNIDLLSSVYQCIDCRSTRAVLKHVTLCWSTIDCDNLIHLCIHRCSVYHKLWQSCSSMYTPIVGVLCSDPRFSTGRVKKKNHQSLGELNW